MKSNRIKLCKEKGCRDAQTTDGFCRYHYLKNWKSLIKDKKKTEELQDKYIAMMAQKYSDDSLVDSVRDEIIGRASMDNQLSELGIKKKDLKENSSDNPFQNIDVDVLLENIQYDDNY